ncbi:WhiB family transcriptional regulator [Actinomycetospora sp. NBC_00405]|uniref:WhiB family transcriptional regulator n=1 Tax=Actinomycetospora sp. NBC_00405 TaxID=2975952 RepID=UPI002E21219C
MSWQTAAACRDADPELFFPPSEDDASTIVARHRIAVAPICGACPVATECLRWALDSGQDHGLWAATTPTDRRAIRRARMAGVPDPVADAEPMCSGCALLFPVPAVDGQLCAACTERTIR